MGVEIGVGLLAELRARRGLRFLRQHQRGRIDRRLHRGLGGIGAAVVDRGADEADDRNRRKRKGDDDVAASVGSGMRAAVAETGENVLVMCLAAESWYSFDRVWVFGGVTMARAKRDDA